jgi:L-ascorbate metabolism protein UlaG (beta-lactamase superfamily)
MKIRKLGHCCLVIETNGKRIMTDPGSYTVDEQVKEKNIDLVLITHEHGDHLHVESLKKILVNNPRAVIITNSGVGKLLDEANIKYEIFEGKKIKEFLGVELEAHDCRHEEIFEEYGQVQNTGYFIDKKLFYPGDSFYNPGKPVEILALPVAGPWTRIKDFLKYALDVKPEVCFPVHDGGLKSTELTYKLAKMFLTKSGIIFKTFEGDESQEF